MNNDHIFIGISVLSIANGLLSPFWFLGARLVLLWMPELVGAVPQLLLFGGSLIVSFATLLIAGIPAALFERLTGRRHSDRVSMLIWLAGAVVLFLPAAPRLALLF